MVKLSEHAILDKIAKHVNIQVYDRDGGTSSPRIRLELRTKGMDASLIEEVMAVQTPCVRCGKPVSPFRKRATRTGGAGRVDGLQGHVYIAIACPLKDNYGCCRGAEADHEYVAIRERVCAILGVDPGSYSTKRTTTGRTRSRKTTNEEKAADPSPPVHNVQQETVRGSDPETTEISKHLDELQDEWNKGCSCRCGACSLFDGRLIEIVDTILRLPAEANNTAICLGSFALEWVQACECSCDACSKLSEGIENVIARLQAYADKPKSVDGRDVAPVPDPYGDFAKMKQDVDGYIAGDTGPVAPAPQAVPTPPPSNAREQRVIEAAKELEQYSATHGGWIEISSVEPHVAAKALELVQAVVAAVRALDGMEARVEYGKSRPPCLEEYCDGACSDYCALHAGHEGTHVAHNGAVRWATGGKAERCIRTQDGVRCALPGGHDFACDFTRTKKEGESNCHYQGEMTWVFRRANMEPLVKMLSNRLEKSTPDESWRETTGVFITDVEFGLHRTFLRLTFTECIDGGRIISQASCSMSQKDAETLGRRLQGASHHCGTCEMLGRERDFWMGKAANLSKSLVVSDQVVQAAYAVQQLYADGCIQWSRNSTEEQTREGQHAFAVLASTILDVLSPRLEQCLADNPISPGAGCQLLKGHAGLHVNGTTKWGEGAEILKEEQTLETVPCKECAHRWPQVTKKTTCVVCKHGGFGGTENKRQVGPAPAPAAEPVDEMNRPGFPPNHPVVTAPAAEPDKSTWCGGLVRCPTCGTMHNESGPEARKIRDVVKPATETAARYVGAALNQIAAKARGLPIQVQEYPNRNPKFVASVGNGGVGGQGTTAQEALLDMAEKMEIRVQYPTDASPRSDAVQPSEEKPWVPCRFCGKGPDKVKKLIQAPDGTTICDACVDLAWDIVHDKVPPKSYDVAPAPEKPPSQPNTTRRINFHVDFDGDPAASTGSLTLQAEDLDLHTLQELISNLDLG